MAWQKFEKKIREIASLRWNCVAIPEEIAGVKLDCVLKPEEDHWILVEITENNTLDKVRTDITKLSGVRNALFHEDIYCKCYIVMSKKPTDSMRTNGNAQKVTVMSGEEFQNEYFDYGSYVFSRSKMQFGSLVNVETGKPENNTYIDVSYMEKKQDKKLKDTDDTAEKGNKKDHNIAPKDIGRPRKVDEIIDLLKRGKRVVLKGDFGLGKSRCVKEIFDKLTQNPQENPYVIAVNLRDHWGARRAEEIILRHFKDLGLEEKNFIKTYRSPGVIYLLDGFDEIGTQTWSSDRSKMKHIREMSVCGLKDLIGRVQGGVLITGREYYFNSDQEMFKSLGLNPQQVVVMECQQEFTDSELLTFIEKNIPEGVKSSDLEQLPPWLPKRPLVIQLLLKYASDIFSVKYAFEDICGFWYAFLSKLCEREAKIHPALIPDTIRDVLLNLARQTRMSKDNTGPITQKDLSNAFVEAAGFTPNDETAIMLQRLPSLGRISADSPDRQFLDSFILNGLRAENIIQASESWNEKLLSEGWIYPLDQTGLSILSEYISKDVKRVDTFLSLALRAANSGNSVLAADIVAALCMLDMDSLDFKGLNISDSHFSYLSFEGKEIHRLTISNSVIDRLDLTNSKLGDSTGLSQCLIANAYGIASRKSVPEQVVKCDIESFELLATTTLIKRARLSEPQKLFVEMLRKIFFQPGAGRKESALLRGMGVSANRQLGEKILKKLLDEKLIERIKGDEGSVYKPVRKKTGRIDKMLTDLTLSTDPLWQAISELS